MRGSSSPVDAKDAILLCLSVSWLWRGGTANEVVRHGGRKNSEMEFFSDVFGNKELNTSFLFASLRRYRYTFVHKFPLWGNLWHFFPQRRARSTSLVRHTRTKTTAAQFSRNSLARAGSLQPHMLCSAGVLACAVPSSSCFSTAHLCY